MANCIQFPSENTLDGCKILGRFGSFKTESEQNSVFRTSLLLAYAEGCTAAAAARSLTDTDRRFDSMGLYGGLEFD